MKTAISPAELFFEGVAGSFEILCIHENAAKFHYHHEFFVQLETMGYFNGVTEGVQEHMVMLRSAWVPPASRGRGSFVSGMELLLDYARGVGVAVVAVANPFDLSHSGRTPAELENIFVNEIGFSYTVLYEEKKLRQRRRMQQLGFRSIRLDSIGNRNRIKRKDCLLFLPQRFDQALLRRIVPTF